MVAPILPLQLVQVGVETSRTSGLIAATSIMDFTPGGATLTRDLNMIRVRNAGSMATSHRSWPGRDHVGIDLAGTCTYNWLPWWMNMFLGPLASGVNGTADKLWTFVGTSNTVISDISDNLKSASFEVGGRDTWPAEFKIAGCVGDKFSIDIKQNAAWTYKASMVGTAITQASHTGALSQVSTLTDVLGVNTKVYLDTTSGFGTTQKTGDVISATIEIDLGQSERFTLDGTRNPYRVAVANPRKISAKVIVEWDALTEYTNAQAGTAQRLRIKAQGAVLGSSYYIAQFDIPGTWDSLVLGQDGGVITEELTLTGQYDSVAGMVADIGAAITNASATLP